MNTYEFLENRLLDLQYVGELDDANGVASSAFPVFGDYAKVWLKIEDDKISNASFKSFARDVGVACLDVYLDYIIGKNIYEILCVRKADVEELVGGGLKLHDKHVAWLATDVVKKAVDKYKGIKRGCGDRDCEQCTERKEKEEKVAVLAGSKKGGGCGGGCGCGSSSGGAGGCSNCGNSGNMDIKDINLYKI